jgi:hypothetical protein
MASFIDSMVGFAINLAIVFVIVKFIYYPQQRNKDYVFTFIAFNTIIFFVMGLLNNTELSVGVGFGLFAIFSILRYRTETIPIREMTYLFVITALPVFNAVLLQADAFAELVVANLATIAVLFVLEREWGFRYEIRKTITYERIEMIRPDNWPMLLRDLEQRTGLPIKRIEIGRLNFLRDSAEIHIYYDPAALDTETVKISRQDSLFIEAE